MSLKDLDGGDDAVVWCITFGNDLFKGFDGAVIQMYVWCKNYLTSLDRFKNKLGFSCNTSGVCFPKVNY